MDNHQRDEILVQIDKKTDVLESRSVTHEKQLDTLFADGCRLGARNAVNIKLLWGAMSILSACCGWFVGWFVTIKKGL